MARIEIRATVEDKDRWSKIAFEKGLSLSELLRSTLNGVPLQKQRKIPKIDPDLLRELARIGNNLNQLARVANSRRSLPSAAILLRLIEIDRELTLLRDIHEAGRQC